MKDEDRPCVQEKRNEKREEERREERTREKRGCVCTTGEKVLGRVKRF